MSDPRFSSWFRPTKEAFAQMPAEPAVIQVKVGGPLIRYPLGQSAMVWYGSVQSGVSTALAVIEAAIDRVGDRQLLWRYLLSDTPETDLERLLRRFVTRFGGPPALPASASRPAFS